MEKLFRLIAGAVCALILPVYGYSLWAQLRQVPDLSGNRFWFLAGALLWGIVWFLLLERFQGARTKQHELNHWLWVELMGGRFHSLQAGRRGGMVRYLYPYAWGQEVITLAPYFFPLFALPLLAIKLMVQPEYEPWVCAFLGMAWAWFYLDLAHVLTNHVAGVAVQEDLSESGRHFSTLVILAMNLFFTGMIWTGLSTETSISGFLKDGPVELYRFLWTRISL